MIEYLMWYVVIAISATFFMMLGRPTAAAGTRLANVLGSFLTAVILGVFMFPFVLWKAMGQWR